jgi:hypothetical protein
MNATKTGYARFDLSDLRTMCDTMTAAECVAKITATLDAEATDWDSRHRESVYRTGGMLWITGVIDHADIFSVRFADESQKPVEGREFGNGDTEMVIDGECCSCRIDRLTVIG